MIAALQAAGMTSEAGHAAARLMRLEPGFSLAEYAASRMPYRDPAIRARMLADLRGAGLPD
jgi:hypothetical protein